ncbi:carboxypeptidase-like regulatory domain-containing protein, partial [bacterium]|nr:carboxypeptidase-like regulatory domain-containing protein [bacterium]
MKMKSVPNYGKRITLFLVLLAVLLSLPTIVLAQATIFGEVWGDHGWPVSGATVQFGEYTANTGPMGEFMIDNVVPGDYEVTISHPDYVTLNTQETVVDGQNYFGYQLEALYADFVVFRVYDSENDQNIEGASVTFDGDTQLTNVNGIAQWMHVLLYETYTVVIEAEGYQTYTEDIYIEDDMPHEIGLDPLATIFGEVWGDHGWPVSGATVQFGEYTANTGPMGEFMIDNVVPGDY